MALDSLTVPRRGRPSAAQLADRLERAQLRTVVLTDEVLAITAERAALCLELARLARVIGLAAAAERPDVQVLVAERLQDLAASLERRGIQ